MRAPKTKFRAQAALRPRATFKSSAAALADYPLRRRAAARRAHVHHRVRALLRAPEEPRRLRREARKTRHDRPTCPRDLHLRLAIDERVDRDLHSRVRRHAAGVARMGEAP